MSALLARKAVVLGRPQPACTRPHLQLHHRRRVAVLGAQDGARSEVVIVDAPSSQNGVHHDPVPEPAPAAAAAAAAPAPEPAPTGPIGIKIVPAAVAIGIGLALRFVVPIPEGITAQAWSLLSIFVSTILGLVLDPLPVGAWAFMAVTVAVATKTLTFAEAFAATTNEIIWLIVVSFFFAKGFEKTGLGERIATLFVKALGKSTLGLSYGLNVAEALMAPAMPSTSARAGGIFVPIIKSLAHSVGSEPGDDSRKKMGSYLIQSQFQTGVHTTSFFLTASAQNLLCLKLAGELGAVVPNQFATWLAGAFVPAIVGTLLTPLILYKLSPPTITDTPDAPAAAAKRLEAMGPMSRDETIMSAVMGAALVMWMFGEQLGISPVLAAMMGLCGLLCTGVLTWRECLSYTPAWDTLCWFAVLIGMSGQLNSMGVINAFAGAMGNVLTSLNMGWMPLFGLLHVAFFVMHYMFASQTAHVGALYSAFCAMMLASGVPPVLAAMSLAYSINLFGSITHYASGQAAVFYGSGFMRLNEVFTMGAVSGFSALAIWGVFGMPIWKLLGWW
ncbi:hypothetical protein CHLRE_06g260450v5 [Chlamydomonas reinhardtii]|uniref:Uncharacterized protein n=1 Tax=Chlamydomonas reinhardtii TaxID=3055 RepID=A0A2K3DMN9_CHLRE|nr:uncharacterized protein CHLRE_06g260450v5 [Chlamydomonas reinhardtii]PNW81792.1 hypothetical protein CHLRE_06g260450v5 [Chlamydomonas reinhardtii]